MLHSSRALGAAAFAYAVAPEDDSNGESDTLNSDAVILTKHFGTAHVAQVDSVDAL